MSGSFSMEDCAGNKVVSISRPIEIRKEQQEIASMFKKDGMNEFEASDKAWEFMLDSILKRF